MNPRLSLQLPVKYAVTRLGPQLFGGMTLNISRSGILVECLENAPHLQVGDEIQVQIELPVVQQLPARCIACDGRVVRLDNVNTRPRIALIIRTMQFQDAVLAEMLIGRRASAFYM